MLENQHLDKKSLRAITKANPDWKEIAKDCVGFANGSGGTIIYGIEDDCEEPPIGQLVPKEIVNTLVKKIAGTCINVSLLPQIITHANGAEMLQIHIQRNASALANTTDGKYFIRIGDTTKPVFGDEINRLLQDKSSFVWELQKHVKLTFQDLDQNKVSQFVADIQSSDRPSNFVKQKTTEELLSYYFLLDNGWVTNLGVLWLGKPEHRARLMHAPTIQFIKYDDQEKKINKIVWDDYQLNPKELIQDVWDKVLDFKENIEFPDGLYRKNIYNYDEVVIRELLANALVHRPYGTRGDIFINLFTDRLEIHNPGNFPLGITSSNILHESVQRNPHLARVFYELKLMEKEGSGYDTIYEALLSSAKPLPEPIEDGDRVVVTIRKRISNHNILNFMDKVNKEFTLKTKEQITLGLIAQHNTLSAFELGRILNLDNEAKASVWIGRLLEFGLVTSKGKTKGVTYFVPPKILQKLNFQGITTLKKIEPHRLRELLREDLGIHSEGNFADIHKRIGIEIPVRSVRVQINNLVKDGVFDKIGLTKAVRYRLINESKNVK
jgi:ATP-dependent DNA helicase RecG